MSSGKKALTEAQEKAVTHVDGPMMVLAGPGSGKTLVITERTRYLVEKAQVSPGNILVVTFTKAAAQEMRRRFDSLMGGRRLPVSFGTFHAIFSPFSNMPIIIQWAIYCGKIKRSRFCGI